MTARPAAPVDLKIPGYAIHKRLGQGGMATVYLATQEKLKREVALKVILPQHASDPEFRDRFISEGQLTARLFHRHVMTVFDIGEANGCFYMATEVLSGGTLEERLPQMRSVVEKLLVLREVAEGLGYAHAHQVIHRDIKPGNVLFRADGTAVVADFGIAKALDMTRAQTMAGMIVGTPSYMSPEQVQGQPLDGRSDLYSLGIMFYQMLTGVLPFVASDLFAVAMAQIARNPDPLPAHLAPLQPLLDSMVEKLPERRIASAAALCSAIDELLPTLDDAALSQGAASQRLAQPRISRQTTAVSGVLPPSPAAPRRRMGWIGGGVGVLLLAIAAGWLWWSPSPPAVPGGSGSVLPTAQLSTDEAWLQLASDVHTRIQQRRYFEPAGGSALDALQIMLREKPNDIDALELVGELTRAVASDAEQYIDQGDRLQAGRLLSHARSAFANDPAILAASARLAGDDDAGATAPAPHPEREAETTLDAAELHERALAAEEADRITTPAGDNAVHYYRAILRQDGGDRAAQAALRRIADDYKNAARQALERGNTDLASVLAVRGLQAVPGDPDLIRLRDQAQGSRAP
jgi:hypothetical protein